MVIWKRSLYGVSTGFNKGFGSKVCKLGKSLCGLKQSPGVWFEKFTQSVKNQGYIQGQTDHTLFKKFSERRVVVLIVCVDDIILTGDDMEEIDKFKSV